MERFSEGPAPLMRVTTCWWVRSRTSRPWTETRKSRTLRPASDAGELISTRSTWRKKWGMSYTWPDPIRKSSFHFISFISRAKHRWNTLTQDISRLKCYPSCYENGWRWSVVIKGQENMIRHIHRYNLLILAVGGDGPSPSSKSIRSRSPLP